MARTFLLLLIVIGTAGWTSKHPSRQHHHPRRSEHSNSARPNIVLILADDLGWADVGFHGSRIDTPNIDRLVREGVELDRFYVSPICSPTRAALLSGRSPIRFGAMYTITSMPEEEFTIAERLQRAGYQTAFVGKWHLGRGARHPNAQGFSSFYGFLGGLIDYDTHEFLGAVDWQRDGRTLIESGYSTNLLGREAVRVIEDRDPSRPFLLFLSLNAPHFPNQAPRPYVLKYERRYFCFFGGPWCRYAAQVDIMDQQIGHVLDALDRESIAENTIVLFLSDNGGERRYGGKNQPLRGQKGTVFDGGIRVPAVIRWPGTLPANRRSLQYARDFDIYPTLEAAAGLRIRAPSDGMNLWPVLMGAPEKRREPFFFSVDVIDDFENQGDVQRAAIHRGFKLVAKEFQGDADDSDWDYFLFDIENDPAEQTDIAEDYPRKVLRLVQRIERWERLHPPEGARLFLVRPSTIAPLREELMASLIHESRRTRPRGLAWQDRDRFR